MAVVALVLQFTALAYQKDIMKNQNDQVGNNLFSFIAIMGIVVCFFKLLSDCLAVYGAINVSCTLCFGRWVGWQLSIRPVVRDDRLSSHKTGRKYHVCGVIITGSQKLLTALAILELAQFIEVNCFSFELNSNHSRIFWDVFDYGQLQLSIDYCRLLCSKELLESTNPHGWRVHMGMDLVSKWI